MKTAEIKNIIKSQQEEKYGPTADPTKFGEAYEPVKPDLRTEKETEEDWERSQDWEKVQILSDTNPADNRFERIKLENL